MHVSRQPGRLRTSAWRLLLAVALVGGFVGTWFLRPPVAASPFPVASDRILVHLRGDEPQLGPVDAIVTIVEFSDFACDACSSASGPLREIVTESSDVRLIFKHYAGSSAEAAHAAFAAHKFDHFWEMHDWLLAQGGSASEAATYAAALGIDPEAFTRAAASDEAERTLKSDREAGSAAQLQALPGFFVNGRQFVGDLTADQWRKILDEERAHAQKLIDTGLVGGEIHTKIVEIGTHRAL